MPIAKPIACSADLEARCTWLDFGGDTHPMNGRYAVRGAVCWPVNVRPGEIEGFALVAGQHLGTKVVWVFEETRFYTIDHVMGEHGKIDVPGLSSFLNRAWATYFCDRYYTHQDDGTQHTYRLQVLQSPMIQPKPFFVDVPWDDDAQVDSLIDMYNATKRGKMDSEGPLNQERMVYQAQPGRVNPAIHALKCLLASFERFPYRRPAEE